MAAALVDQNELASLRIEQSQLITLLKNKEGSLKSKIIRLAEIMEKRILLADPEFDGENYRNFSVSQISTEISRMLKRYNVAIAPWVSEYLPDKYKDPIQQNNSLSNRSVSPSQWGGIDPSLLIEELSHLPSDEIKKLPNSVKIVLYDTIMKDKNLIESDALEQHYQLNDKQQRDPIRTSRPFPPRVTKYSEAIHKHADLLLEWEQKVINDCAPPPELEQEFADGEVASYKYLDNFINEKYSLGMGEWLERDIYRIHQSKHGAAVKDKVETLLCKSCSILNREKYEPGDFVEMEWNWSSPTHWKCPECGGSEHVLRGLTREQCGDKALQSCPQCHYHFNWEQGISPMETQAVNLVNNLMGHYNSLNYYNTLFQKCTATRRIKLGVDLSSKA